MIASNHFFTDCNLALFAPELWISFFLIVNFNKNSPTHSPHTPPIVTNVCGRNNNFNKNRNCSTHSLAHFPPTPTSLHIPTYIPLPYSPPPHSPPPHPPHLYTSLPLLHTPPPHISLPYTPLSFPPRPFPYTPLPHTPPPYTPRPHTPFSYAPLLPLPTSPLYTLLPTPPLSTLPPHTFPPHTLPPTPPPHTFPPHAQPITTNACKQNEKLYQNPNCSATNLEVKGSTHHVHSPFHSHTQQTPRFTPSSPSTPNPDPLHQHRRYPQVSPYQTPSHPRSAASHTPICHTGSPLSGCSPPSAASMAIPPPILAFLFHLVLLGLQNVHLMNNSRLFFPQSFHSV